jgi:hypothetical protein
VVSTDLYHTHRPDVIICLVTTQVAAATAPTDYVLEDWAAAGGADVLRIEVVNPKGESCRWYRQVLPPASGKATFTTITALNDAPGLWQVVATNVVTGQAVRVPFEIAADGKGER